MTFIVFIFKKFSSNSIYSVSTDAYFLPLNPQVSCWSYFAFLCFSVIAAKVSVRQRVWGTVGNKGAVGGMGTHLGKTFHGQARVDAGARKICLEKERCPAARSWTGLYSLCRHRHFPIGRGSEGLFLGYKI